MTYQEEKALSKVIAFGILHFLGDIHQQLGIDLKEESEIGEDRCELLLDQNPLFFERTPTDKTNSAREIGDHKKKECT